MIRELHLQQKTGGLLGEEEEGSCAPTMFLPYTSVRNAEIGFIELSRSLFSSLLTIVVSCHSLSLVAWFCVFLFGSARSHLARLLREKFSSVVSYLNLYLPLELVSRVSK